MLVIDSKSRAQHLMRVWETETNDNICDQIDGLQLDQDGDFVEPPSYSWDEAQHEVNPVLQEVKPKTQVLRLIVCCEDGTSKIIITEFSEQAYMGPHSRVTPTVAISDIPETVAADIIESFIEFQLAVRERVEVFNAARRRAYHKAAMPKTIEKVQSFMIQDPLNSTNNDRGLRSGSRRRQIVDHSSGDGSSSDLYSAVAPFFKADEKVMDAAERALSTFDSIGSPYPSVQAVMKELGAAIEDKRKEKARPAIKRQKRV